MQTAERSHQHQTDDMVWRESMTNQYNDEAVNKVQSNVWKKAAPFLMVHWNLMRSLFSCSAETAAWVLMFYCCITAEEKS